MAFREETDLDEVDRILLESKARNPDLEIGDTRSSFKDPTIWVRDDRNSGLLAFSLRNAGTQSEFFEGSYGTASTDRPNETYDARASLQVMTESFRLARLAWGENVIFSCAYGISCPWIQEMVIGKNEDGSDNYFAIDVAISTLEALNVTMVKLDPPRKISISYNIKPEDEYEVGDGLKIRDFGLIYCHSDPILVDER